MATAAEYGSYENCEVIGEPLGLNPDDSYGLASQLVREGLAEMRTMNGNVRLSAAGRHIVEEEISPTPQTTSGNTQNILHIGGNVHGTAIQLASHGSTQVYHQSSSFNPAELERLCIELGKAFARVNLSVDQLETADANLGTLLVQSSTKKPDARIVKSALESLREFAVGTGASLAAAAIESYMKAHHVFPNIF